MADESQFGRLRFHSLLLFLEGLVAIVFIFVDPGREGSRLPITALFPLVLYTYGLHGALSTAVLLFIKRFKAKWSWLLLLHGVSLRGSSGTARKVAVVLTLLMLG
jgi:hypothetical protein